MEFNEVRPDIFSYLCGFFMLVFGVVTLFFTGRGKFFDRIKTLDVLSFVPIWVIGIIAILIGVMLFFPKIVLVGYLLGTMFTGILVMCSFIALYSQPEPHSPVVFIFPLSCVAFTRGVWRATITKYS